MSRYVHHFASEYGWKAAEILALSMKDANALFAACLEARGHTIRKLSPSVDDEL